MISNIQATILLPQLDNDMITEITKCNLNNMNETLRTPIKLHIVFWSLICLLNWILFSIGFYIYRGKLAQSSGDPHAWIGMIVFFGLINFFLIPVTILISIRSDNKKLKFLDDQLIITGNKKDYDNKKSFRMMNNEDKRALEYLVAIAKKSNNIDYHLGKNRGQMIFEYDKIENLIIEDNLWTGIVGTAAIFLVYEKTKYFLGNLDKKQISEIANKLKIV